MKKLFGILFLSIIIPLLLGMAGCDRFKDDDETIHIAVVGPMTGDEPEGKGMVNGIDLYVEEINKNGGINEKEIILDIFDDQNNANEAQRQADKIIDQNQAVAVIGHMLSAASLSAGKVYKKYGIPAISPTSSNVILTRENDWYFRIIYNDEQQGAFLAYYAKEVLGQKIASIAYEGDNNFCRYLAQSFEKTCYETGVEVRHKWALKTHMENSDPTFQNIANELKSNPEEAGIVFLSLYPPTAIPLIKAIKDVGISNPLIVPDVMDDKEFYEKFNIFPKEKKNPGYYTNGIYVPSPLIFDTANAKAHLFRDEYQNKYKKTPTINTVFSYDAVMVLLNAIKYSDISGKKDDLEKDRRKIRDYLTSQTTMKDAVIGVTGPNYFNEYGDCLRPLSMGFSETRR